MTDHKTFRDPRRSRGTSRSRVANVVGVVLLCAMLAGCVTTAGGVLGDLSRSARSAASDLHSAALALDLYSRGDSTIGVSETALDDAVTDLTSQQESVSSLSVSTSQERNARAAILSRLDVAVHAVIRGKEALTEADGAESVHSARKQATRDASRMKALAIRLEKLW